MAFTLALAQCTHPADGDVVSLVRRYAQRAACAGAQLLVFPESLMTRYENDLDAFQAKAEPLDGPFSAAVDAIAAEYGLWMVYTVNERNDGGLPFNAAVLVDDCGRKQGVYRKTHLFDTDAIRESDHMARGSALFEPVQTPFAKIGLAICYDLRFPEVARHEALAGAQLILYPAAWVDGPLKVDQWRTLLVARAIENEVFVAGLSRVDKGYIGQSAVVDPRGRVIGEGRASEGLVTALIDTDEIAAVRAAMPVFDHRRPDLY